MQMTDDDFVELNLDEEDETNKNVSKEDVLEFFKTLAFMPTINLQKIYEDIISNGLSLPKFKFHDYGFQFCNYKDENEQNCVIIWDTGSDNYYYLIGDDIFSCNRYKAGKKFYSKVAKEKKESYEDNHDSLRGFLGSYEAVLFIKYSVLVSSVNEFIEDNIYTFNNIIRNGK